MVNDQHGSIEKALQITVVVLSIAIIGVMLVLVKGVFFDKRKAPRSQIEKQLYEAEKELGKNPNDLKARLKLAITYSQMGKYKEANEQYNQVIKADKKKLYTDAYYLLSLNYEKQGKIKKAVEVIKNRKDEQSLYQLGRLYVKQEKYQEAIGPLKKAAEINKTASDTLYYLGLCLEKTGKNSEAKKNYKKALVYAPDYSLAKEALKRLK